MKMEFPSRTLRRVALIAVLAIPAGCGFDLDLFDSMFTVDVDQRFRESRAASQPADLVPPSRDFTMVFLTDVHVSKRRHPRLASLRGALVSSDQAVLFGGDNCDDGRVANYDFLAADQAALGLRVYNTLGNHDLYLYGWTNFRPRLGPSSYQVAIGEILLTVFDSATGTLGAPQKAWLEEKLARSWSGPKIVMTHYEMFLPDPFEVSQYNDVAEIAWLTKLYEKNGIQLVLSGHSHLFDDRTINGVRYLTGDGFKDDTAASKKVVRLRYASGKLSVETFDLK